MVIIEDCPTAGKPEKDICKEVKDEGEELQKKEKCADSSRRLDPGGTGGYSRDADLPRHRKQEDDDWDR